MAVVCYLRPEVRQHESDLSANITHETSCVGTYQLILFAKLVTPCNDDDERKLPSQILLNPRRRLA